MKKRILPLLLAAAMIMTMLLLASCGENQVPQSAYIDDNGNVVLVYEDGSENVIGTPGPKGGDNKNTAAPEGETAAPGDETAAPGNETAAPVTLVRVSVNEENHAIAEYSDGHTEDLGYVGVEVEPPMYTVTFVDANGNTLSSETLYKGRSATAPEAPAVVDKIFDGWDTDFTNVQSDLTVRPVYKDMESYTVKFLDASGNVIKTETVIYGRAATAPAEPTQTGKVFNGWDTDFSSVKSDLTVKPTFRDKGNVTVKFVDYSGLVLGSTTVPEGDGATAPATPSREGYTFTGWNPGVGSVWSDTTAVAQYRFNGGNNVIDISYTISGNTVTVKFTVRGTVKFAGCDIEVQIPSGLTYGSLTAGTNVVANKSGSSLYFSVASTTNITNEMLLGTATFTTSGASEVTFNVVVSEFFDQNQATVGYKVIGKKIKLK